MIDYETKFDTLVKALGEDITLVDRLSLKELENLGKQFKKLRSEEQYEEDLINSVGV